MTIVFLFKNGKEIRMKCENFNSNKNEILSDGMITGFNAEGITENKIIGINFSEVIAVYRVVSDEVIGDQNGKS